MNPTQASLRAQIRWVVFVTSALGALPLLLFGLARPHEDTRPDVLFAAAAALSYILSAVVCSVLIENLVFNQFNLLAHKAKSQSQSGIRDRRTPAKMINIDRGLAEIFLDEDFSRALKRYTPSAFRPIRDYSTEPIEHSLCVEAETMLKDLRSVAWSAEGAVDSIKQDIFRHFSHQLKSPMAVVRSHAQNVRSALNYDEPPEKVMASLDAIDESALSVVGLIDQVLSMAHIDHAGRNGFTAQSVNLQRVANLVMNSRQIKADDRDILIRVSIPSDVYIRAEPGLIQELLCIFVDNAIHYAKPGCDLEILAQRTRSHVELIVQDEGPGIPRHERANVLKAFYGTVGKDDMGRALYGNRRHRSLTDVSKSTHGLGLSLASSIVELHKGVLVLDDRPDGKPGLRVLCKLPLPT